MLAISSTIVGSLISSSRTTKCLYCDNYGTEKVSFISDNARVTKRLESTVIDDLERAGSIKDTAARTALKRDSCKKISEVNRFFKLCGVEGCKQIKAVAMDQNAGFASCVNKHCPNAKVVYDLLV